eukprot:CAMPEP_0174373034 /NCGR_PEP_ID=MMETSP0811_2-20130205/105593_1 /TAXON_ID=73025 ORGANISM="Eutreptiella gymnastica-like, Strain CCMP1594" /NCGR_SAMPLE_ID=MMETSP0811_2 /ASSEMBLY_ACC=CAM_ASM_000667 /LENGTH=48 /DNA_ID= /DNA_START= /DNA_END= /DNA_ORIENTATION=
MWSMLGLCSPSSSRGARRQGLDTWVCAAAPSAGRTAPPRLPEGRFGRL